MDRADAGSARPRTSHWRRRALMLCLLLLPLLIGELGVRALIATHRIPPAQSHYRSLDAAWTNLDLVGTVDVLVTGNSMAHLAVDPAILADLVSAAGGGPVSAFNLAISGAPVALNTALLRRLAVEGRLPKVVVLGITPIAVRADLPASADGAQSAFLRSSMGELFTDCGGIDDYVRLIDCSLGQVSALWRWRGRPGALVRSILRPVTAYHPGTLRADGFGSAKPRSLASIERQVIRALAHEPRLSAFDGRAAAPPLLELSRFLADRGVALVPVLIPTTPPLMDALEAREPGWYRMWISQTRVLEQLTGMDIIDPGLFGSWWGEGKGANVKHLSRDGAVDFTRQLWGTPGFRERVLGGLGVLH